MYNPIYSGVTVKTEVRDMLKKMITDKDFYNKTEEEKRELLRTLNKEISESYNVSTPKVRFNATRNYYRPVSESLHLKNTSVISFLHEYRHHLQHTAGKNYQGLNKEEDARAWSLRLFKLVAPNSFLRSVKQGRILHIRWDAEEQRVVNA